MNSFGSPFNRIASGVWNLISRWKIARTGAWNKHGPRFRVTAFVTAHLYRDADGRARRDLSFWLRQNFDMNLWGPHIYFRRKRWIDFHRGSRRSTARSAAVIFHHAASRASIKIPRSSTKLLSVWLIAERQARGSRNIEEKSSWSVILKLFI